MSEPTLANVQGSEAAVAAALQQATDSNASDNAGGATSSDNTDANQAESSTDTSEQRTPWASYLDDLPESVRPLVEPKFREWDSSVTKRFQSLQSEYDPYKSLISEYEPSALEEALRIAQAMEANPQEFLKAVAQAYNLDQGTADQQGDPPDEEEVTTADDDNPLVQRIAQLEKLLEATATTVVSQREAEAQVQAEKELDSMLASLKEKHGEFDERFVLMQIANGIDPEQAVQSFNDTVKSYATKLQAPNANAPSVVSGNGGGYPTQQRDLTSLDEKGRKNLVVEMLRAAAEQNG